MVYTFTFFFKQSSIVCILQRPWDMLSIIHDMIRNVGLCEVLKREKLGKVSFMVQQSMLLAILPSSLIFILYNIICLPL